MCINLLTDKIFVVVSCVITDLSIMHDKKLLKIEGNMINPKKLAGPPTYTLHWSVVFIILINTVIGVLGYISYGDGVLGSISLNLPSNSWLVYFITVKVVLKSK